MANRGLDFKTEIVHLFRDELKARAEQVKVFTADPRFIRDIPCLAINEILDSEDDAHFDNLADVEHDASGATIIKSGLFTVNCEVRLWTENADLRDSIKILLKEIAILIKDDLNQKGFGNVFIKGGRDENDFKTYQPHFIYWWVFNYTALAPLEAWRAKDTEAGTIKTVDLTYALDGVEQEEGDLVPPGP